MSILDRIRNRSAPREAGETGPDKAGAPDEHQLPIARYDRLDAKEVASQLSGLTQVELAAVETYERRHGDRAVVLDKLCATCAPLSPCPATTPSTQTRSSRRWPAPTVKPSGPCATTSASSAAARPWRPRSRGHSRARSPAPPRAAPRRRRTPASAPRRAPDLLSA
jgi:hypothetical protein